MATTEVNGEVVRLPAEFAPSNRILDGHNSVNEHRLQSLALVALSIFFLPLDIALTIYSLVINRLVPSKQDKNRKFTRNLSTFKPKTILVTGVGMTKGLALARTFYTTGHNVIGADFEDSNTLLFPAGRVSKAVKKFYPLSKPNARDGSSVYIQGLLNIIKKEKVDIWVSCSGVASAVEDGEAKETIERVTSCKCVQFDVETTKTLHEKDTFIQRTRELDLIVPETHSITSRQQVDKALKDAPAGRTYIMKTVGMDDSVRGNMTLLPLSTSAETSSHLDRMQISEKHPWILQQYIKGREYCTHALIVRGVVKVFCACPSAELLMHYRALSPDSTLAKAMLKFTLSYAIASGKSFTGHCSFDFLVEDSDLHKLGGNDDSTADVDITLYPIECNPRAHTAVALFQGTAGHANAYLSLLDDPHSRTDPSTGRLPDAGPPHINGYEALPNGIKKEEIPVTSPIVTPAHLDIRYFWAPHDFVTLVVLPVLDLLQLRKEASLSLIFRGVDHFLDRLLFWKDGTYERWDPLPYFWLYHIYWPCQFAYRAYQGQKWSRVNVSTCKTFEC